MNYYRRYVGDYLRDTSRLSLLEHGAYSLMLDYCYADERPLPIDRDEIYLLVRAMTPADKRAVDKVLGLYFTLQEDGWHQARVDEEIYRARDASETARDNGRLGGRPKKITEKETKPVTNSETNRESKKETGNETNGETNAESYRAGDPTTNHQPPPASHQPPLSPTGERRAQKRAATPLPAGFAVSPQVREWAERSGFAHHLQAHLEHFVDWATAKDARYVDWDATFRNAIRCDWGDIRKNAGGSGPRGLAAIPSAMKLVAEREARDAARKAEEDARAAG